MLKILCQLQIFLQVMLMLFKKWSLVEVWKWDFQITACVRQLRRYRCDRQLVPFSRPPTHVTLLRLPCQDKSLCARRGFIPKSRHAVMITPYIDDRLVLVRSILWFIVLSEWGAISSAAHKVYFCLRKAALLLKNWTIFLYLVTFCLYIGAQAWLACKQNAHYFFNDI